jgi:DMSO/TMAO reductase YedYZ molybdopterin-dependent catalytic subunit
MAGSDDNSRDGEADKLQRVVDARMKLKQRFEEAQRRSPSVSDDKPLGEGPPNRHGMPLIPPGQVRTEKWPVLDLGVRPRVTTREQWSIVVDGAVKKPFTLDFKQLMELPQVDDTSDFHCVTTWSKLDVPWRGVRVSTLLGLAEPADEATHLMIHGSDGYTTNVSLAEATKDDVLLAHTVYGQPLPLEHGGPVRMITPQLYAWKGSKWVSRLEVMVGDKAGFWEERGYSMTAYPWRDDRYR